MKRRVANVENEEEEEEEETECARTKSALRMRKDVRGDWTGEAWCVYTPSQQ